MRRVLSLLGLSCVLALGGVGVASASPAPLPYCSGQVPPVPCVIQVQFPPAGQTLSGGEPNYGPAFAGFNYLSQPFGHP